MMRTNIEIDDKLMKQAMKAIGATTKKQAVEEGLRRLVRFSEQAEILKLKGKITWEDDQNEPQPAIAALPALKTRIRRAA